MWNTSAQPPSSWWGMLSKVWRHKVQQFRQDCLDPKTPTCQHGHFNIPANYISRWHMEEGRGGETGTKAHQFLPSISKALTEYTAPNMNKRHSIRQQHLNKCTMVLVICHLTKMGKKRNTKDKMTHIPVQSVNDPSKNKQSVLFIQVRHNTTRTGNSLLHNKRQVRHGVQITLWLQITPLLLGS